MAARPGASSSRRILACALVVLVPGFGVFLAFLVRRTRGGGIALEPPIARPTYRLSPADAARLGEHPSVLDRLLGNDADERVEALVALSSAGDAGAVAVLRWTIEHGPNDVVLDAALTLEEIELQYERALTRARDALAAAPTVELAIAFADAAAAPVLAHISDPCATPALADDARAGYRLAAELAPQHAPEIEERLAYLELAAGHPRAALAIVHRLIRAGAVHLTTLRDAAAFAAREFGMLTFAPMALECPPDLTACRLQIVPS
jgi:hypothetical protein